MNLEFLCALILGCATGIFTGITPGVHINLVSTILFSVSPFLLSYYSPLSLASFIFSMSITHTFIDFIPTTFLGAPDSENSIAALPAHKMLLEAKGYEAVKLSSAGAIICLALVVVISPVILFSAPIVFNFLQDYIGYILIVIVCFMILRQEDNKNRLLNFFIFLLSGVFGLVVFGLPGLENPLLPMLSGLFGVSTLLLSVNEKVKVPKQEITDTIKLDKKTFLKSIFAGTFSGGIISLFPGMGPSQAAILGNQLSGKIGDYGFIILVGGIGTVSMFMSIITLLTIDKARNGAIVVLSEIVGNFGQQEFLLMAAVALIAGGIGVFLSLSIAKTFSNIIPKVNYNLLCISIIFFVTILVSYLTGIIGFLVLLTSTAIGLIPAQLNLARNQAMGCLLLPVILYFIL